MARIVLLVLFVALAGSGALGGPAAETADAQLQNPGCDPKAMQDCCTDNDGDLVGPTDPIDVAGRFDGHCDSPTAGPGDACDAQVPGDQGRCDIQIEWTCTGDVSVLIEEVFMPVSFPNDIVVGTVVTGPSLASPIIDRQPVTPKSPDTWEFRSGPLSTAPLIGAFNVSVTVTGSGPQGLPFVATETLDINTDCVTFTVSCANVTATLYDNGPGEYPPQSPFTRLTLDVVDLGEDGRLIGSRGFDGTVARVDLVSGDDVPSIIGFSVTERFVAGAADRANNDPYGAKQDYKGAVNNRATAVEARFQTNITYESGQFACLDPFVVCSSGEVQVRFDDDEADPAARQLVQAAHVAGDLDGFIPTVNDELPAGDYYRAPPAGTPEPLFPGWTYTFLNPTSLVLDEIVDPSLPIGPNEVFPIRIPEGSLALNDLDCNYPISYGCVAGYFEWSFFPPEGVNVPSSTTVSFSPNVETNFSEGEEITVSVSDGVWFTDSSGALIGNTVGPFTVPDCDAEARYECVEGVPTLFIEAFTDYENPPRDDLFVLSPTTGQLVAFDNDGFSYQTWAFDNETAVDISVVDGSGIRFFDYGGEYYDEGYDEGGLTRSISFDEIDCKVEISVECVDGRGQLSFDPSDTDLFGLTVNGTEIGIGETAEFDSVATLTMTSPSYENGRLALVAAPGERPLTEADPTATPRVWQAHLECVIPIVTTCEAGVPVVKPTLSPDLPVGAAILLDLTGGAVPPDLEIPNATPTNIFAVPAGVDVQYEGETSGNPVQVTVGCRVEIIVECIEGTPSLAAIRAISDTRSIRFTDLIIGPVEFPSVQVSLPDPEGGDEYTLFGAGISGPAPVTTADVPVPLCTVEASIVCRTLTGRSGTGGAAGAFLNIVGPDGIGDLNDTGTTLTSTPTDVSGPLVPGTVIFLTLDDDQVWFSDQGDLPPGDDYLDIGFNQYRGEVPYCTVDVDAVAYCVSGDPRATITISPGGSEPEVTGGTAIPPAVGPLSRANDALLGSSANQARSHGASHTYEYSFDAAVMEITVTADAPDAVVRPDETTELERPECEIAVNAVCTAGTARLIITRPSNGLTDTPEGTTLTPPVGAPLSAGPSTVRLDAESGVVFTDSSTRATTVIAPTCEVTAMLVCHTKAGLPTGMAELIVDLTGTPGETFISTVPAGPLYPSGSPVGVSVSGGVVFASTRTSMTTLDAPDCIVTVQATAVCAVDGITITATTSGAAAAAITVNGEATLVTGSTTVITKLAPLDTYIVGVVPANPTQVVAGSLQPISIAEKCRISLDVTVVCERSDQVRINVVIAPGSTGAVSLIAVNEDSNRPFLVAPGTEAVISVKSPNTLAADMTIPSVKLPTSCDGRSRPVSGALYVDYQATCAADAQSVIVDVDIDGLGLLESLAVNGDDAAPYVVKPGADITVVVLPVSPLVDPRITGPEIAPVCIAPTTPTPTLTPTLPPARIISIPALPVTPGPTPSPDPTTEPTSEPDPEPSTPGPTPTPNPDPTTEPTSEPDPEPSTPGPTPTPNPDPTRERIAADPAAVRQHGTSAVLLPAACDVEDIDLPGAVTLVRDGVAEDGRIRFVAETATLDVGEYKETVSCSGVNVDIVLFIYRQIGGARGEANSISRLAGLGGVLTVVLVGVPGIVARREPEMD